MPSLDIFEDDAFSVTSLTKSINENVEGQAVPALDGLFMEEGVTTTAVFIEREQDGLALVPAAERGAPGSVPKRSKRNAIPFSTVHLPQTDAVIADEVQNVRAFGSETEVQAVQTLVDKRLAKARRQLDATNTYHRVGAMKGQVLDADGSTVLLDVFQAFGLTQQEAYLDLDDEADVADEVPLRVQMIQAKRLSERALGRSMLGGFRAYCGEGFFESLIGNTEIYDAFARWQDGEWQRSDPRPGFLYAGIQWVEFYGKVGEIEFIDADSAYLVPLGVNDLFITRYAPADYLETVNTNGLPYYSSQELMKHNKGIEIESQMNVLNLCTKPRSIIKLNTGLEP